MRLPLPLALAFVVLAPPAASQAIQPDLVQTGNGARAVGLGYAFTAIADDATAMSWNPAGMAQLVLPEASVVINARGMYPVLAVEDDNPAVELDSYSASPTATFSPLNFASVVYPVATPYGAVVLGASYRDLYDWQRSYEYRREYSAGNEDAVLTNGFTRSGGIKALSLAAAYAPTQWALVGATVSRMSGNAETERRFSITGNNNINESQTTVATNSGYNGTIVDLGVLLRPAATLSVGLKASLPHDRSNVNGENGVEEGFTLRIPMGVSVGLAYAANENNRVAVDVRHQPWSTAVLTDTETGQERDEAFVRNDITSYHVGYENLAQHGSTLRAIRLGAFTRPSAFNDAQGESQLGLGGSLGLGWATPAFALDLALNYIYVSPYSRTTASDPLTFDVQENEALFTAGFTYYL